MLRSDQRKYTLRITQCACILSLFVPVLPKNHNNTFNTTLFSPLPPRPSSPYQCSIEVCLPLPLLLSTAGLLASTFLDAGASHIGEQPPPPAACPRAANPRQHPPEHLSSRPLSPSSFFRIMLPFLLCAFFKTCRRTLYLIPLHVFHFLTQNLTL